MSFTESIKTARQFEIALSAWYQRKFGAFVLPTYDYSGLQDNKAPKLQCMQAGLVVPDLLVCKDGRVTWVECKWKTHAVKFRKTGRFVTGINSRHFENYQKVSCESGCKVYLMFLHVEEHEMRGGRIRDKEFKDDSVSRAWLPPIHSEYEGKQFGGGGMVFWDWSELYKWADLQDVIRLSGE